MKRSPRLILVLLIFGIGLLVAGVTRMDMSNQAGTVSHPASPLASTVTGLIGAAMIGTGAYLLRNIYRHNQRTNPLPPGAKNYLKPFLITCAVLLVLVAVVFAIVMHHT